ncbi:MAG: pseudouridine synthase [Muribaculum sp.]|uniref:Pseudouridine synthase n=1 Tax=Candidatus Merdivivens faecigallinarum TaxID=2840871 RepID=A0A9D9J107_9BACT|nr:pseudouridine synthase [Candidatus Merdivivens faecigallinarum]
MLKDFQRKGSSAADGAAPERVYRKRENRSFNDNPRRREEGRNEGFRRSEDRGFRRSEDRDFGRRKSEDRGFGRNEDRGFSRRRNEGRGFGRSEDRDFDRRRNEDRGFGRNENRGFSRRRDEDRGFRRNDGERPSFERHEFRGERRKFGFDKEKRFEITRKKNPRATIKSAQKIYKREEEITGEVRLNKFIANSGICSRREADKYIQAGVITVNGNVVSELGVKVKPTDDIRFNGERLLGEKKIYIVMNKPKDYVTTTSDPHAEKTVMDLLKGCKQRVFPVGRLDKSTTGVLLFTNDGRLADKLTHPAYNKKKIYQVTLDRKLSKPDFDKILEGIWLPDGEIHADELAYTDDTQKVVGISIHSGRNRIIRRIFESLNYKILKLDRVYFAGLTKKRLTRGEWRYLEEKEVNMLLMGAYE